jgi:hypothetical protein
MLNLIFDRYWDICCLRASPENTPYSITHMVLSGVLLILLILIEWNVSYFHSSEDIVNNALTSICVVLAHAVYSYLILYFKGLAARWVQTITTLYYVNIIIHVLVIPLLLFAPYLSLIHVTNPLLLFIGILYLFLSLGLSVWQFVITANVYKFALNISPIQSVLAAFGLIAVNILTVSLLQ